MDSHRLSFQAWAWQLFLVTWFNFTLTRRFRWNEWQARPHGVTFCSNKKQKGRRNAFFRGHVFVELPPTMTGWRFQIFLFSPLFGEDSHFDYYFSDRLKPPTSMSFMKVWEGPLKKNGVISPYRLKVSGPMANRTGWEAWRCFCLTLPWYRTDGRNQALCVSGTTRWSRDLHGLTITMVTNDLLDGMILQVVDSGQQWTFIQNLWRKRSQTLQHKKTIKHTSWWCSILHQMPSLELTVRAW